MKFFVYSCMMLNSSLILALLLLKSPSFPNERGSLYRCLNRVDFVNFLLATMFSEEYAGSWTDPWAFDTIKLRFKSWLKFFNWCFCSIWEFKVDLAISSGHLGHWTFDSTGRSVWNFLKWATELPLLPKALERLLGWI